MDIDYRNVQYRAVNQDGYWFIAQIEHDANGHVTRVNGPVFPQGAHPDDLRVQLVQLQTALESPISADDLKNIFGKDVRINLRDVVPSKPDQLVLADGAYSDTSDIPVERNSAEEEATTRAAQAIQHATQAKLDAGKDADPVEVAVAKVGKAKGEPIGRE